MRTIVLALLVGVGLQAQSRQTHPEEYTDAIPNCRYWLGSPHQFKLGFLIGSAVAAGITADNGMHQLLDAERWRTAAVH